jgi:four helix bundle protein
VPANIAEGNARAHVGDYLRHLSIARGSLAESETIVELARRLGYLTDEQAGELVLLHQRVGQMLNRLIQSVEKRRG